VDDVLNLSSPQTFFFVSIAVEAMVEAARRGLIRLLPLCQKTRRKRPFCLLSHYTLRECAAFSLLLLLLLLHF
jgi:hypothetical protein